MIRKKGVASLQIVLLISFSFAVAFIIDAGMVIGQPETVIVASRVPPSFETGSYFNIPIEGEGIQTVKWLGEKDGIQNGILSNGDKVTWPNIDPANIQLAEVGGFQDAAFGKTLEFGGGKFDAITAINKPETIPGLLDNGKITAEGAKALESQLGVKNAAVSSGGQLISGQASAGIYEYSPFGQDFLSIGGEGSIFGAAGGYVAHLAQGAVWAGVAYGAIQLIGGLLDLEEGLTDALSYGFAGGLFAYKTAYGIAAGGAQTIPVGSTLGPFVPWIGLGVGIAIFVLTYKKQKRELVRFECLAWEAPLGGESCELCNEDPNIPCSEYRCKSLGQGCELENVGTENEVCIWMNEFDVSAPKITPWDDALSPSGLEYVPDSAISPPNRGFKLLRRPEGCLAPFTPLEFGIITDEPAQCRVDYEPKDNFDDMQFLLGESTLFLEEHTQTLKVPTPFTEEGDGGTPEIHNDGTYSLYVRCIDANGNGHDSAFVAFSFCVEEGPDTSQPFIVGTSIEDGKPVSFGVDTAPIEVYVNEPANCRWSHLDRGYAAMENEMNCNTETYSVNADLNYVCIGTLTGIKDRVSNDFYFRCEDLSTAPGGRNVMETSYHLSLLGSEELVINSVGPEGEFFGSTSTVEVVVEVETAHGANEGNSICYISTTPNDLESFIAIDEDNVFDHSQSLYLGEGDYTYHFLCRDEGGNVAQDQTSFSVLIDRDGPTIARVLRDGSALKVITNEPAECAYSLSTCNFNFEDGLALLYEDPTARNVHFADWNILNTYYVKCRDLQGNQPSPDSCSIIAKGSEL